METGFLLTFSRFPFDRSSITCTIKSFSTSASTRLDPINPAPPMTTTLILVFDLLAMVMLLFIDYTIWILYSTIRILFFRRMRWQKRQWLNITTTHHALLVWTNAVIVRNAIFTLIHKAPVSISTAQPVISL